MRLITDQEASSGSGYNLIQEDGTPLTARTTINFTGAGVTASDSGSLTTVNIPGGAGTGASGTTTIDFGAFPGKSDASVAITGQASILTGSVVDAWLVATATADHTADEHLVETIRVTAGNIVAATGFTIYATNTSQLNEPAFEFPPRFQWRNTAATTISWTAVGPFGTISDFGGKGTLIWGLWTVHWQWS